MDYVIIEVGGMSEKVKAGDTIRVNRIPDAPPNGKGIELERVLMLRTGEQVKIGSPLVEGASVKATVLGEVKGKKVLVFKKKKRKQYRRTNGHRQQYTTLRIDTIVAGN